MKKKQIVVLTGIAAVISVLFFRGIFPCRENLEPLAEMETEFSGGVSGGGCVIRQGLLEIRAPADNVLEAESDVYWSGASGPDQPDEPDDVGLTPGGMAYIANGRIWVNGKLVSEFGFEPIEEKTVSFETEIGKVNVSYRDNVTMAPTERKVVIFCFSGESAELRSRDVSIEMRPRGIEMLTLDNGIRRDVHHFDAAVKVEGLGEIGTCPLRVVVEEEAYYPP